MRIKIGSKEFEVKVSENEDESIIGLSQTELLPKGEGFAMKFDGTEIIPINMDGMKFSIDVIFSLNGKVTKVVTTHPEDPEVFTKPTLYLHQGGVLGNESMLPRYERKYKDIL